MFPIRDNIPSRRVPIVNYALILLNVLMFGYELSVGPNLDRFISQFGVVPIRYARDPALGLTDPSLIIPVFTSMFLHAGWLHIIGNMVYLYIFGDNVEDRMGHLRYLVFYLLCGLTASYTFILSSPFSRVPSLGASGAIAGVLGAYLILYPGARVLTLVFLGIFITTIEIPALMLLGIWFIQQLFSGYLSISSASAQAGGVAWWAHIGGFVAGMVLVFVFREGRRRFETWSDDEE